MTKVFAQKNLRTIPKEPDTKTEMRQYSHGFYTVQSSGNSKILNPRVTIWLMGKRENFGK